MTSAPESIGSAAIFQAWSLGLGKICPEFGADLKGQVSWDLPNQDRS